MGCHHRCERLPAPKVRRRVNLAPQVKLAPQVIQLHSREQHPNPRLRIQSRQLCVSVEISSWRIQSSAESAALSDCSQKIKWSWCPELSIAWSAKRKIGVGLMGARSIL